uniref:Terminase small subunit n=1 Tax=Ralstonia phage BOESR1 TaxID=3034917 RepID=A0AA49ICW6_9CAUD|nr:terminase small subunit [Ralstonia phage BOESR1]
MSNRASEKELGLTHKEFAEWCRLILKGVPLMDKEGNAVLKEDGQPWLVPPSPAHMNVIRQFLKDNAIEATVIPGLGNQNHGDLSDLPTFDEDGNVLPFTKQANSK